MRVGYPCIMSIFFLTVAVGATDWNQCLINIRNESWRIEHNIFDGATDSHGQPIPFSENTTAITYHTCTLACGSGPEPIQWSVFSQQFSSWLLPWLALVSQLPFGANDKLDNLVATLLTVGSPTLAAYSLALTLLNGRWITRRFASCNYRNTRNAVRILISLQQCPLKVTSDRPLLSSLVVLPENDEWWKELVVWLDYGHTWSISAAASIAWAIIAYIFNVVDSFTVHMFGGVGFKGQAIGSMWLWLLPIVLGWLQISPKCDSDRLHRAVKRANKIAYVAGATSSGEPKLAGEVEKKYAISLNPTPEDHLRCDEGCTVPVYNYVRFLPWVQAVETVASAFHAASENARQHPAVRHGVGEQNSRDRNLATREEVEQYCNPGSGESLGPCVPRSAWLAHIWSKIFIASAVALGLQWGTTGAAVLALWFTPTIGLGCRSGSYILYAAVSTLVWLFLLLSSFLSYYVTSETPTVTPAIKFLPWIARVMSILLRRVGKVLAACNAIWIVTVCLFHFSNFFESCWCNSSMLMWKSKAYAVLRPAPGFEGAWVGGAGLAVGAAVTFIIFGIIFINPKLPAQSEE